LGSTTNKRQSAEVVLESGIAGSDFLAEHRDDDEEIAAQARSHSNMQVNLMITTTRIGSYNIEETAAGMHSGVLRQEEDSKGRVAVC
jgi:hypothetical protein